MSDTVIKVENLSKQYRLGELGTGTLSHDLNRWWHKVRGKEDPYLKVGEVNDRTTKGNSEYVWAIQDINFEVKRGEVLGIIGKNGAGKSTLLKILSRVTAPTTGRIRTKGRIASLLEVGTGFHDELTGRENIFLNGAIMGMTKAEVRAKLDEIIDFSGTERYVDTPVKRYSSGMRVRLGFAVAAHLEPEILIVDEVLAVGDAEFQKKAIGKMQDVTKDRGRTVLFVSHNMVSIQNLCTQCIMMESGYVTMIDDTQRVINYYTESNKVLENINLEHRSDRRGNGKDKFTKVAALNENDEEVNVLLSGQVARFGIELSYAKDDYRVNKSKVQIDIGLNNSRGERISWFSTSVTGLDQFNNGFERAVLIIRKLPLTKGNYSFTLNLLYDNEPSDWISEAFKFEVEEGDFFNTGRLFPPSQGNIMIEHQFSLLYNQR